MVIGIYDVLPWFNFISLMNMDHSKKINNKWIPRKESTQLLSCA